MRKLFFILFLLPFIGCSSDDKDTLSDNETLVTIDASDVVYPNTKVAYFDDNGLCKLIIDLGDLTGTSKAFEIPSEHIKEITIFSDYGISESMVANYAYQMGSRRQIVRGESIVFVLSPLEFGSPVSKKDSKKYPQ